MGRCFEKLTGKKIRVDGDNVIVTGQTDQKGDLVANGLTILPWRKKIVNFSIPVFPTGIWLIARAGSPVRPIIPIGDINIDIKNTKKC